tara:strand:- start:267 stop:557 length:291 start_codon:yes stop_codon:yes gene_type:complete
MNKKYLKYIEYIVDDLLRRTEEKQGQSGGMYKFPWCDITPQHCELYKEYVQSLYENLDPDDVFPPQVEKWVNSSYGVKGGEYMLIMDMYLMNLLGG